MRIPPNLTQMNRREWITQTGALVATGRASDQQKPAKAWFDRPMRWAQLAFVEDDPGRYDPVFWLEYFKRIHADAVCLSAGGCVAFYPTRIPLHYRSKFLGSGDTFGEMLAGCPKLGMNVIARVDPHAAHQDVYDAHPDWIAVEANGRPRRHWAMPTSWVTCALGPYNFEFMTAVVRRPPSSALPTSTAAPRLTRITRLMALAIKLEELLRKRVVQDYADIARLGLVSRARVTQIMNLLNLAPDIQETLLFLDRETASELGIAERNLRRLTRTVLWDEQRVLWQEIAPGHTLPRQN